jgi:selenide, water dikinase
LAQVLRPLRELFPPAAFPHLLVGLDKVDDAAVYQLNETQAIISTTDFFPPVVDDPYDFGAIAAANALSDVYAMGGQVLFAMNLVAFPDNLDKGILAEILRGGAEKVAEAGGVVVGGHSVVDKEPKYGLAVTGLIDPALVKRKGGARPGDILLLTKPLGVGVITTAHKRGWVEKAELDTAVASMKRLNKQAAEAALAVGAHAMTDITGYGLLGHGWEMAQAGGVAFHFSLAQLPFLPGAALFAEREAIPGGTWRNEAYFAPQVSWDTAVSRLWQTILWTPETSGGLLVAVAPEQVEAYQERCERNTAVVVGYVTDEPPHLFIHS